MASTTDNNHIIEEEESYYVSMTDLMVGVVFIFIIILMYFALRYQQAEAERIEKVQMTATAQEARNQILQDIKTALEKAGIQIEIDEENGILHLPEELLFPSGSSDISPEGKNALGVLSPSLMTILPCYTPSRDEIACASRRDAQIEAVFIEGHTDNLPLGRLTAQKYGDNWGLSSQRAIATYKELKASRTDIDELKNFNNEALFSVSGYSMYRPRAENDTEQGRAKNRRIDLRFLMKSPRLEDLSVDSQSAVEEVTRSLSGGAG